MKFILGKKQNMTQVFNEEGTVFPVTVISAGPMVVTQVKTKDRDGYESIQFGYGKRKKKNINKAQREFSKENDGFSLLREYRINGTEETPKKGDMVNVSIFSDGDEVSVRALSKGKGFQGVVKRHGFHGGPRSHGQKHSEREPGSIGGGLRNRVPKGMRMAGRMGSDNITVKNLKIIAVDTDNNLLMIKGAIPGRKGTVVEVKG
jgi:large subunit ribosomal protein L3